MKKFLLLFLLHPFLLFSADWKITDTANTEAAGKKVEITEKGKLVARLIYGEGQLKPYLQVFGENQENLTDWKADQKFPHHRGIYVGWNKIASELGSSDLWHLNKGERMIVQKIEHTRADDRGATLVANIEWHAAKKDTNDTLLLREKRTLKISRPAGKTTQVDALFELTPGRDLTLGGDLQHAGVHFRASSEVGNREKETSYLWEPEGPGPGGKVSNTNLQWARLIFPISTNWHSAMILNAPGNPVKELSWRAYGRFGFFFDRPLKSGETLILKYRFLTQPVEAPADNPKFSKVQLDQFRKETNLQHSRFVKEVTR